MKKLSRVLLLMAGMSWYCQAAQTQEHTQLSQTVLPDVRMLVCARADASEFRKCLDTREIDLTSPKDYQFASALSLVVLMTEDDVKIKMLQEKLRRSMEDRKAKIINFLRNKL